MPRPPQVEGSVQQSRHSNSDSPRVLFCLTCRLHAVPCVQTPLQVKSGTYDFEANKALLKLYQFFPDLCKSEAVALMLAKVGLAGLGAVALCRESASVRTPPTVAHCDIL